MLFSIVSVPFYFPTNSAQVVQILHTVINILIAAIPMDERWYLTVVFIDFYFYCTLRIGDVVHLFLCLLVIYIHL